MGIATEAADSLTKVARRWSGNVVSALEGKGLEADRLALSTRAPSIYDHLVARFRGGKWTAADNVLKAPVEAPPASAIGQLPPKGSAEYQELAAIGQNAIDKGEVGMVVLTGGMATRFGWDKPKGLYPVLDNTSFLGWKLKMAQATGGDKLPVYLMTSFHTQDPVAAHLADNANFGLKPDQVKLFQQGSFRRLTPEGQPFKSPGGQEDFAAPGHGDIASALRDSGLLAAFRKKGGKTLLVSNVDNLGATPDPALIGYHIKSGNAMTGEVAAKAPGDKGGVPAMVGGKLQLVEGFALPKEFNQDSIPVFNTANYLIAADALDRPFNLPWYVVDKEVGGQKVIQFEHLAGDLSTQMPSRAGKGGFGVVEVPRDERFIPVKGQGDLPHAQALIRAKVAGLKP